MPYFRSRARRAFEAEIDHLKSVIAKAFSRQTGISDPDIRDFILGQTVILSSAKFEDYIQDIITGFFQKLNVTGVKTEALPLELRAFLFNDDAIASPYKRFIVSNDENKLLQSLGSMIGSNRFSFMFDGAQAPTIIAARIYADVKYPSPKNMLRLFRRLGIRNVFHEINRSSRSDLKARLESFNDLRTEVAHIGRLVGKNEKDIKALLDNIKQVIMHVDRVFCKHACKISSLFCWPT